MAHSKVAYLSNIQNRHSPSLTTLVKGFFLDIFSHEQYLLRKLEDAKSHGHLGEAASYAIDLHLYDDAFTLYNQDIAKGNWRANIPAAELAEMLGDYRRGIQYRLRAEDYAHAGLDAARLGQYEDARKYFAKLQEAA